METKSKNQFASVLKTELLLAWRNIWRNKRRTLITAASVFLAVLLSSLLMSIQRGAWDGMIDNILRSYTGYVQIHKKGYWDEQTINKAFHPSDSLMQTLQKQTSITAIAPRLESFALASAGNNSRGVMVTGTDPLAEEAATQISKHLIEGDYFEQGENAVLIPDALAAHLQLKPGDTLVLIGQGYHGVNAAGKYVLKGILHFPSPELNERIVFLPLKTAQQMYGAENLITTLALFMQSGSDAKSITQQLQQQIDTDAYELLSWMDMMPELLQARAIDTAGALLMLAILYLIVAFGIFGTLLMMTRERLYEIGVLIGIGMKRYLLGFMFWLEITFIGLIGALLGLAASFPVIYYFYKNPIDLTKMSEDTTEIYRKFGFEPIFPAAFDPDIFVKQAVVVFILTTILAIYPYWVIHKTKVVEAMKS